MTAVLNKPAPAPFQACLWCADEDACRRRRGCGVDMATPELFGGASVIDLSGQFERRRA